MNTAALFIFSCNMCLLSAKVGPNQTAADANPFALPGPEVAAEAGEIAAPQIAAAPQPATTPPPPQPSDNPAAPPPQLSGTPAAPARAVLQSARAADARAAAAFAGQPGWMPPAAVDVTPKLAALSFDGAGPVIPSPVCSTNLPDVSVRVVALAARGGVSDLATLVEASEAARLRAAPEGFPAPEMTAAERSLAGQFSPGRWRAVAVDFSRDVPLAGGGFGGSAGRPEWARNWRGEIAEVVCFDAPPDADTRAGVAHYPALRWRIAGVPPATAAQRQAASDAGLHSGLARVSVFTVK